MIQCCQSFYIVKSRHRRFHELKKYFEYQQIDLSEFKQVTRQFTDVFKVPSTKIDIDTKARYSINSTVIQEGIDLSNESFDFEMLRQMLGKHFISQDIVTKDAKRLITQLATLYGLTADGMKHVILIQLQVDNSYPLKKCVNKHARII